MNLPQLYDIFNEQWRDFQNCWIIADTHFGDKDMQLYWNYPEPEEIVKNINSCVGKKDMLIILGDVGDTHYVPDLKGYKVLVMGNHDKGKSNYYRKQHIYTYESSLLEDNIDFVEGIGYISNLKVTTTHEYKPIDCWKIEYDNQLFDEVYSGPLMIGQKLLLSHEPVTYIPGVFNLHGHDHSGVLSESDEKSLNLCAEKLSFKPLNFNQWLKKSGALGKIDNIHEHFIYWASNKTSDI